jgi:hypothetical protein
VTVAMAVMAATFIGAATYGHSVLLAGADPIADCSTTSGEIVVVDFTPWGGNWERGCAATLSTGYAGLQAAGFTTAGDDHDGPALICRLDNYPPPSQDACINTPPASAYWSDWHAAAGQNTWTYSQQGPMSYEPQPGSVDAWVFGGTNVAGTNGQPAYPPNQFRALNIDPVGSGATTTTAPPTTPPTTAGPTSPPAAAGVAGNGSSAGSTGAASAGSSHAGTTLPASGAGTSPTSTTAPSASTTVPGSVGADPAQHVGSAGPKIVDASPAAAKEPPAGSPLPFIIGAAVVVLLAGAGGIIAWRRRRLRPTGDE